MTGADLCFRLLAGRDNRRLTGRVLVQVDQDFLRAFQRDVMILVEVDRLRFDSRPVLHRFCHPRRELGLVCLPTHRALLDLGLMLGHLDRHRRQIEHLALLMPTHCYLFQRGLTVRALLDPVYLAVFWMLHRFQGMPFVPRLTTALLAAALAQTARSRLLQPIAGGRLAAVATVLRYLIFQLLHSACQLQDHRDQGIEQRYDRLFPLQVSGVDIFVGGQTIHHHSVNSIWRLSVLH